MSGFNASYLGVPPWDIGRPQGEVIRLEQEGAITGSVLDCGCGTGENALYLATRGHEVWGIDAAPRAIRKAKKKAKERGANAAFLTLDAFKLATLERTFDTLIDCGLFHVFSDADRERYVAALSTVTRAGTTLFLLCFSNLQPGNYGPRRITMEEIRHAFREAWRVSDIRPATFDTNLGEEPVKAWLGVIVRA